jgi:hypothetical protein
MSKSSLLGGEHAPVQSEGRGADRLGPSDSSDSGSDAQGELGPDQSASDTDRSGTGERASANPRDSGAGLDILPDHVDRASRGGPSDASMNLDQLASDEDDEVADDDGDADRS